MTAVDEAIIRRGSEDRIGGGQRARDLVRGGSSGEIAGLRSFRQLLESRRMERLYSPTSDLQNPHSAPSLHRRDCRCDRDIRHAGRPCRRRSGEGCAAPCRRRDPGSSRGRSSADPPWAQERCAIRHHSLGHRFSTDPPCLGDAADRAYRSEQATIHPPTHLPAQFSSSDLRFFSSRAGDRTPWIAIALHMRDSERNGRPLAGASPLFLRVPAVRMQCASPSQGRAVCSLRSHIDASPAMDKPS